QRRERFVGLGVGLALGRGRILARRGRAEHLAVEAAALAGVAGGTGRIDQRHQRVAVAVVAELAQVHEVPRSFALLPELVAGAAVEMEVAVLQRQFEGARAHVSEHQNLAAGEVLDDARHQALLVEFDFGEHPGIVNVACREPGYSMPRRSSRSSSRRQCRRTRTWRSRWTRESSSASSERRAPTPISWILAPLLPIRIRFCDSVSAQISAVTVTSPSSRGS